MKGLVLEGGGARGAYQVGALKALKEMGITVQGIAGTSVGALNGAMIVQGDIDQAYELWSEISPARIMNIDEGRWQRLINLGLQPGDIAHILRKVKEFIHEGGIDVSPLRQLLEENIDEAAIRRAGKDFAMVTVSLSDLKPMEFYLEDIPRGKLVDYLLASASLPMFRMDPVDGRRFLDGGFYDNLPIGLLLARNYQVIIVIRTFAPGRQRRMVADNVEFEYIIPSSDLGGILDFDQQKVRNNLQTGYYDARRYYQGLQGFNYYIYPDADEEFFFHQLLRLNEKQVLAIGDLFGLKGIPYRRMLFEYIIPRLCDLLKVDGNAAYQELGIKLLEEAAGCLQLERFKIYYIEELAEEIKWRYRPQAEWGTKDIPIPPVLKHSRVMTMMTREDILREVAYYLWGNHTT
ncbi:patatin-like phospholipase family protein [Syntrophomonas erecta]